MNCSPTITAEDFAEIHNAKCELIGIQQSLEGVLHPDLQKRLENAIYRLNKGLANAYEQDEEAHERKEDHYQKISDENGFKSIWSVSGVTDLNAPFAGGATHLLYKDHWGKEPVVVPIEGNTWVDLWRAAEKAIDQSGDTHHIFVESFRPGVKPGFLILGTGS